ncbi:MAG: SDR family oxidoreductase [Gemmatimonadetes bacterium]|jgi:NAD(P)-dependent dehydrogenase (short-subunit alcohol dehydrogenase family)|nr:SDR family oxidoreductase [Gemmatimonadota bacterium]
MTLEGKVALITGAGSGIGAATARLLANAGASVALVGIPAEGVQAVAAELETAGHSALPLPTDVSDPEQVQAAVAHTVEQFGRLDILIPNAGIQLHREDRDLHQLPEEIWDRTHDVNYRGVFLTCKYGLAQFVAQSEGGVVVIVSSVTALSGSSPNVSYVSGKHGLVGLGRYIGVHYAQHAVRCNVVCPGALEQTPNFDVHPDPDGRKNRLEEAIPLGRLGKPEDIAPFIAFLAGPDAGYATGACFVIDGGLSVS